ncbi:hypothetical protein M9H77_25589 [Catharanthus roseus]|uniref:Uncharacterized protein n=1 Tax=Catharanthus roseus TaxID=4058 RepID=A0ACC0A881_CATRO|nr:hypothetical protein M9H77_25589 [Catharanthus roseus]
MLGSVTLDLDPVNRGRSTVGGLGPRRYYVGVRRGPPARVAHGGLADIHYGMPELVPVTPFKYEKFSNSTRARELTGIHRSYFPNFSAERHSGTLLCAVDLAEKYRVSQNVHRLPRV